MLDRGRILIVLAVLAVLAVGCGLLFQILVISPDGDVPRVADGSPPAANGPRPAAAAPPSGAPGAAANGSGSSGAAAAATPAAIPPAAGPGAALPIAPPANGPAAAPAASATITGRVLRPDGAPQPEALVAVAGLARRALGMLKRDPVQARARTGADGRFELQLAPADGELELTVTCPDFPVVRRAGIKAPTPETVDLGLVQLVAGAGLRGQVRSEEAGPLGGVLVRVQDPLRPEVMGGRPMVSVRADAEGRFVLRNLAPGEVRVQAQAEGFAPSHLEIHLEPGRETAGVELLLRRGLEIRGLVVDEQGLTVADAVVTGVADRHVTEARTAAAGSFVLPHLRPTVYRLFAKKPGYGMPDGDHARWDFNAGARDVRVRVERRALLAGVVRDGASGQPVSAFTVAWGRSADDLNESKRFEAADGSFELPAVRPGAVVVEVRSARHAPRRLRPIAVRAGDRLANLEVVLTAGGAVVGRVLRRSDGAPLAGVAVLVTRPRPPGAAVVLGIGGKGGQPLRPLRTVKTGADGRFRVEHLSGAYALHIRHPGFAALDRDPVRFPDDAQTDLGDLQLGMGGTLTGRVPGKDGRGDAGAQVWVHGPGGFSRTVATDAEGRFALDHVPPGRYRATITRRGGKLALEDLIKMSREGPREVEVCEGQVSVVQF